MRCDPAHPRRLSPRATAALLAALATTLWAAPAPAKSPPLSGARLLRPVRPLSGARLLRPVRLPPAPLVQVGWGGGEQMTFTIKFTGVEGGRGAISVGMPRSQKGKRVLWVRGLSETVPFFTAIHQIREELITLVDLAKLTPLESTSDRVVRGHRRKVSATFGHRVVQLIQRDTGTIERQRPIAPPPLDALTALCLLRSAPLPPGATLTFRVLSGLSLYQVRLQVMGQQHLMVLKKGRDTIWIDGVARQIDDNGAPRTGERPRAFSLWLTADRARLPVKARGDTKLGPLEANLSSYSPPHVALRLRVGDLLAGR